MAPLESSCSASSASPRPSWRHHLRRTTTGLHRKEQQVARVGSKTVTDQAHFPRHAGLYHWVTTGETPLECLVREANEEISSNTSLTKCKVTAVGAISYLFLTDERSEGEKGLLCPEIQFTYEMRVSADLIPIPGDDEAEGFVLMSIDQLKEALANGEFTPANAEVVLDFFIRHGILTFENEPNYTTIVRRLHRRLEFVKA